MKLTDEEVANVRAAIKYLKHRAGGMGPLATALGITQGTLDDVLYCRAVGPALAFAVARYAKVTPDDLLDGKFPGRRACPNCCFPLDEPTTTEKNDVH